MARMRRTAVIAIAVLLAGACAKGNAGEVVSGSATLAREKGGARMVMTIVVTARTAGGTVRSSSTGSGVLDFVHQRGTLVLKVAGVPGGRATPPIETVRDGNAVYVKCSAQQGGRRWAKIDVGKLSGADLGSFSSDPTEILDYMKGVGEDIKKVGEERVRGVDTTHYAFVVSTEKLLAKLSGEVQAQQRRTFDQMGVTAVPMGAWVDSEGLPRRIAMVMTPSKGGGVGAFEITMELFDYGKAANVSVPPATQTIEVSANSSPQSKAALTQCLSGANSAPGR